MQSWTITRAALFCVLLPAGLAAQVSGRMAAGREFGNGGADAIVSEARPINVPSVLIQHRQQLSLSDAQFAQLVVLRRGLDSLDFPLERRLDSLVRIQRQSTSAFRRLPPDSVRSMREVARQTLDAMADAATPVAERAHALLTAGQMEIAAQYEAKARAAAEERAREAGTPRRGLFPFAKPPA